MHQLAARSLTEPCRVGLVSYCPTMDLIATVTSINQGDGQKAKDTVDVWKLGGSTRAFGATFENGKEQAEAGAGGEGRQGTQSKDKERSQDAGIVTALSWRRDGKSFYLPPLCPVRISIARASCPVVTACLSPAAHAETPASPMLRCVALLGWP